MSLFPFLSHSPTPSTTPHPHSNPASLRLPSTLLRPSFTLCLSLQRLLGSLAWGVLGWGGLALLLAGGGWTSTARATCNQAQKRQQASRLARRATKLFRQSLRFVQKKKKRLILCRTDPHSRRRLAQALSLYKRSLQSGCLHPKALFNLAQMTRLCWQQLPQSCRYYEKYLEQCQRFPSLCTRQAIPVARGLLQRLQLTLYRDQDGDGFGSARVPLRSCSPRPTYKSRPGDCNDHSSAVYPGAKERCDGLDNNCNGQIDEGCPRTSPPNSRPTTRPTTQTALAPPRLAPPRHPTPHTRPTAPSPKRLVSSSRPLLPPSKRLPPRQGPHWSSWLLLGAGVVIAVSGAIVGGVTSSVEDEIWKKTPTERPLISNIKGGGVAATVLMTSGGLLLLSGVIVAVGPQTETPSTRKKSKKRMNLLKHKEK